MSIIDDGRIKESMENYKYNVFVYIYIYIYTWKNNYSSDFCCYVTIDCSRKPKAALSASVEPLTLTVPSAYIARTTDPIKVRDDELIQRSISRITLIPILVCVLRPLGFRIHSDPPPC